MRLFLEGLFLGRYPSAPTPVEGFQCMIRLGEVGLIRRATPSSHGPVRPPADAFAGAFPVRGKWQTLPALIPRNISLGRGACPFPSLSPCPSRSPCAPAPAHSSPPPRPDQVDAHRVTAFFDETSVQVTHGTETVASFAKAAKNAVSPVHPVSPRAPELHPWLDVHLEHPNRRSPDGCAAQNK